MAIPMPERVAGKIHGLACRYPIVSKLVYSTKLLPPLSPHLVGVEFYRKNSVWELSPILCPCDLEFVEYLKKVNAQNKVIFHFGTGSHHAVGIANHQFEIPNQILGITASIKEHEVYVNRVLKEPAIAKYYKVVFADIYTLTKHCLPMLDLVSLFHLGEFYAEENKPFIHQDDESLVRLFLEQLNPEGKLLFYTRSNGWAIAQIILQTLEAENSIELVEDYKSLKIYRKV